MYVMEKTGMVFLQSIMLHSLFPPYSVVSKACIAQLTHACCLHLARSAATDKTLAAAAPYMRRNKMKIGDVIAITRRPDAQLVRVYNSTSLQMFDTA